MSSSLLEGKQFFCRQWVFLKLSHSLEQRPLSRTCGTMIVGGPGSGKTALCCRIVFNKDDSATTSGRVRNLHEHLLAHHFCQAHDAATLSVKQFILNIVAQLVTSDLINTTENNQGKSFHPDTVGYQEIGLNDCPASSRSPERGLHAPDTTNNLPKNGLPVPASEGPQTKNGIAIKSLPTQQKRSVSEVPIDLNSIVRSLPTSPINSNCGKGLLLEEKLTTLEHKALANSENAYANVKTEGDAPEEEPTAETAAEQLPYRNYAERVRLDPDIHSALLPENLDSDPDLSFKTAVIGPISELRPPKDTLFLLVDSIDEIPTNVKEVGPSRTIAELLANHHHLFPRWLVLVCTARRQSKTVARMFTGFRKISLDDLRKSAVIRDVQQYILARLDREEKLRQHISRDTAEMLNQLHIKSNGCFLYLEKVLDGVADSFIILREVREIPGTLNGLYLWLCQRLFNRKQFNKVQPLLNVILASTRALDAESLYRCVWTGSGGMSREDFTKRLHLLRRVLITSSNGTLLPFHHSFAEWLNDVKHCTKKFLCNVDQGHAMIAMNLTLEAKKLPLQQVQELAFHLSRLPASIEENPSGLDHQTMLALWLIDCGADTEPEDVVASGMSMICLPNDPRTLALLVEAGTKSCQQQELMLSSQISLEDDIEVLDPLAELDALALSGDGERTVLHCLAAEGNAELLKLALARGGDLEATDRHGQTALNLASRHGHNAVVSMLVQAGANLDHADSDGWTALRAAAWGGHTQVVECLLSAGADVDSADSDNRTALRAAAWGGHEEIVLVLLKAGADPNRADNEGRTALIAAAYMSHSVIVSHLLEYEALMDHADSDGRTALSVAALCVPNNERAARVVTLLLERGAVVDHRDKDGMTPLLVAAFEGHRDVCELLLEWDADVDQMDQSGRSALWAACSMGHSSVVELLLFWGCSVDTIDAEGRTVLSVAAAQGAAAVVRQLLDRGLDEQHRDNAGWTPLHYATFEGHSKVVEYLMESGARLDTIDNEGKTVLHLASQEGHVRLVRTLLEHAANTLDLRAHDGKTALRLATVEGHMDVVKRLIEAGADVNLVDADGRSALYVMALENRLAMARTLINQGGAHLHTRDCEGRTPLHVSAWQGHRDMVALLIVSGSDVSAQDMERRTSLQSAAWQGHDAVVRLLLENGALPDHTCSQGATALGIAAQEGHEGCVRALLQHGADPNHSDRCGRNALRIALKSGHDAVLRLLEECALTTQGGSSSASGSTTETKPSSAVLVSHAGNYSPVESPDSSKRRSLVSSNSSNLTNSTKSSLEPPIPAASLGGGINLSFTQQLQQCSRPHRGSLSKLLLTHEEDTSPIYNSPQHSPEQDLLTAQKMNLLVADPHFSRDTHMKIILGNTSASSRLPGDVKPKRNGIVTNPKSALRIVAGLRNSVVNHVAPVHHWRKETPL